MSDIFFRPYKKGTNKPITTKWYRTHDEALDWGKTFTNNQEIDIKQKEVNQLLKKRYKTGFRGLI